MSDLDPMLGHMGHRSDPEPVTSPDPRRPTPEEEAHNRGWAVYEFPGDWPGQGFLLLEEVTATLDAERAAPAGDAERLPPTGGVTIDPPTASILGHCIVINCGTRDEALRLLPKYAAPAPDAERPAATLYFTADDIDAALRTIRGEVTREESIVMAAAGAAASALRTGRRIVSMEARNAR